MNTLREVSIEYQNLLYQAINSDEIPPELLIELNNVDTEFDKKIENIAYIVQELMAKSNMVSIEIDRLSNRAARWRKNIASLKEYMQYEMNAVQKKKIDTPFYTIRLRKSESCQVDSEFIEEAKRANLNKLLRIIPEKAEPDKTAIKEFLKQGGSLDHAKIIEKTSVNIG